jgi:transposase
VADAAVDTVPYGVGYPAWFRQRIVDDPDEPEAVAARFGVSVASVYRFRRRLLETGSVQRAPQSGGRPRKLSETAVEAVRVLTVVDPSVRRDEIQRALRYQDVCTTMITRTWARLDFTYKHLHRHFRYRNEERRIRYWCNPPVGERGEAGVRGVNVYSMIDIDEMGAELTECDRHWGHAPRGQVATVPGRVSSLWYFFPVVF